jgi:pyridoxamine 5'-phosphate oxidase
MSFVDPILHKPSRELRDSECATDPFTQFQRWWQDALEARLPQPEAMTLATCTADGKPSARMVLLRGFDERGFVFYTNYQSRKGQELLAHPLAALVLYWEPLDRQVRIEGRVEKTSPDESDLYFQQRPRGSRLGAWASPQSQQLQDREELERLYQEVEERFAGDGPVPRPPDWGGFRVVPAVIEFWQGRPNRLHDRLRFRREQGQPWTRERLAP